MPRPPPQKPIEEILPPERREALRREGLEQPGWYSPWAHLAATTGFGAVLATAAALLLRDVKAYEWLFAPFVFVFANAVEWNAHRDLLHKPFAPLRVLYDRHTPQHHMIYIREDMEMRDPREFRLVLIPAYGIVAISALTAPITAALWFSGARNLACIFLIVCMGYVVMYECLHLAYHLPRTSFIGRLGFIRALAHHHAVHHDPRKMQKWNMNVSIPIWDFVRGTYVRE